MTALGIDDEGGALCDTGAGIENAEFRGEVALDVGEHGEGQVLQVGMIIAPCEMNELGVDDAAEAAAHRDP